MWDVIKERARPLKLSNILTFNWMTLIMICQKSQKLQHQTQQIQKRVSSECLHTHLLIANAINDDVCNSEDSKDFETDDYANAFYYSPACFSILEGYMHLIPLWSNFMIKKAKDYKDYKDYKGSSLKNVDGPFSNATVESYFKTVKHGTLARNKRVRPRKFLQENLKFTMGKVNETYLPQFKKRKLNKNVKLEDRNEIWKSKSKPRKAKYSDIKGARNICKKLSPPSKTHVDTHDGPSDYTAESTDTIGYDFEPFLSRDKVSIKS